MQNQDTIVKYLNDNFNDPTKPIPTVREVQNKIGGSTRTIALAIKQFLFDRDQEQSKNVVAEKALFDKQANQLMTTLWPLVEKFVVLAKNNQKAADEIQINTLQQAISDIADSVEKAQKAQAVAEEKLSIAQQETKQAIDEKCQALTDLNRNEGAMQAIQDQLKTAQGEIRELDREIERLRAQNSSLSDRCDKLEQKLLTALTGGTPKTKTQNKNSTAEKTISPTRNDVLE